MKKCTTTGVIYLWFPFWLFFRDEPIKSHAGVSALMLTKLLDHKSNNWADPFTQILCLCSQENADFQSFIIKRELLRRNCI